MWHIEGIRVCRVFLGKPEGMGPLGRPGLGWDDNIKMGLQEVGLVGGALTGWIWLRIWTGGGSLGMQ
jgi:hypothetical protein